MQSIEASIDASDILKICTCSRPSYPELAITPVQHLLHVERTKSLADTSSELLSAATELLLGQTHYLRWDTALRLTPLLCVAGLRWQAPCYVGDESSDHMLVPDVYTQERARFWSISALMRRLAGLFASVFLT